jgi:hypothetical protein
VAQVPVDVVLIYSPDRLARKYAYQALLIGEFVRAGTRVVFVKEPATSEDALLVQTCVRQARPLHPRPLGWQSCLLTGPLASLPASGSIVR